MAELLLKSTSGKNKIPPRIDLTPMVDLGFLLITFFIFTATLSEPTAMTTLMPADSMDSTEIANSGAITILAGEEQWAVYQGNSFENLQQFSYKSISELRKSLLEKQQSLIRMKGNDDLLYVQIKPTEKARFKEIVMLLDEMKICQMKRYTLSDLNAEEELLVGGL